MKRNGGAGRAAAVRFHFKLLLTMRAEISSGGEGGEGVGGMERREGAKEEDEEDQDQAQNHHLKVTN